MEYNLPSNASEHLKTTGETPEVFLNRAVSAAMRNDKSKDIGTTLPYYAVLEVVATSNFLLLLTFADGDRRLFDADILRDNSCYHELLSSSGFTCAKVDGYTVAWEDKYGIFDELPPQFLYNNSVSIDNLKNAVKEAITYSKVNKHLYSDSSRETADKALNKVYLPTDFVRTCECKTS